MLHLKPHQEIENLLLDRHIECGRGFVGNQELRITGNRNRDHHALALAARHLVREAFQTLRRITDTDQFQKLDSAGTACRSPHTHMLLQDFLKLIADRKTRIEACYGLLKDHRNIAADDLAALTVGQGAQVHAVEHHHIGGYGRSLWQKTHNRQHSDGLARTGFADDGQHFTLVNGDVDPVHRLERASGCIEGNREIFNIE